MRYRSTDLLSLTSKPAQIISKFYFVISMLHTEPINETKENRHFMKYRARKYWALSGCEHVPKKLFIFFVDSEYCIFAFHVGNSHMTCKRSRLSVTLIERNEQVRLQLHFNIMIRNFFKTFAKFTLFCFLFVAKTSFGSLQWRMSGDPSQPTICSRSCNGENTTSLCGKHSVNETTRKRCCVEEGVVVG